MTYDFGQAENETIDGVGLRGLLIGILLILVAVTSIVKDVLLTVEYNILFTLTTLQNVFAILIAIAFILPFFNYRMIARTEGKDITEFMEGIRKMTLGFVIIMIAVLLTVVTEVVRLIATL